MPDPSLHKPIGSPFIELQTVDSTNNYAFSQVHAGMAQHGTVIFAHEQTAGKGQRGKGWLSHAGANIAMTIVIQPELLTINRQFWLSACAAVTVAEWLGAYVENDVRIKWPNDIYWEDRKAGGILIESVISGSNWEWAVIGIGINVNQTSFPSNLPNPVSLRQITGKSFEPLQLAKELCERFKANYEKLLRDGGESFFDSYQSHLYKRNKVVRLKKDNRVFEATIKGISPSGRLIIQHGLEEEIDFGMVEWLL